MGSIFSRGEDASVRGVRHKVLNLTYSTGQKYGLTFFRFLKLL